MVKDEPEARGIRSKWWTSAAGRLIGDKPFSRGALYVMLQNRLYRGEIVHQGQSHPGEHLTIIDPPLWDAVQGQLVRNTAERNSVVLTDEQRATLSDCVAFYVRSGFRRGAGFDYRLSLLEHR